MLKVVMQVQIKIRVFSIIITEEHCICEMTIDIEYQKLKQLYFDNESNLDDIKKLHANLLTDLKTEYDHNEISIYWRKWDKFKSSIEKRKRNKKRQSEQEEEKI